jgi:hypothetical protein
MVCLGRSNAVLRALVVAIAFGGVALGGTASAQAQCTGTPAQCRNCMLVGQPIFYFPGDPGPESRTLNMTYAETGPFLGALPAAPNLSAQMGFSPAPPLSSELLAAAILETMGNCEGPNTFSTVGDGGTVTTNFGPCGTLTDTFSVVSDGTTAPYQINHTIGGNLSLQNLVLTGPIVRDAAITIGSQSATGAVTIYSGTTPLCSGAFSGSYTAHPNSTTTFPWPCTIHTPWTGYSAASNLATGSVTRQGPTPYGLTSITPISGPTSGGTAVELCGPGICTTTVVTLGGAAASGLACGESATCPGPDYPLLAITPAHAAGPVNVVVTNGSATASLTNGYTYLAVVPALPTISAVLALTGALALAAWWANERRAKSRR